MTFTCFFNKIVKESLQGLTLRFHTATVDLIFGAYKRKNKHRHFYV